MSCGGNRFQCGLSKPSRFQFKPDKPSNAELHNENQKRLNDLLKAREEIDNQFLEKNIKLSESTAMTIHKPEDVNENITYEPWTTNVTSGNFTPWKTPSATDYQSKAK
jgi:cell shape-determining protein MreC